MLAQNEQSMSTVTEMSTVSSKSIVTITAQIDINMQNHDKDSIMMSSNQLQTILPVSVAILIVAVIFFIIFIRRVVYKKHFKPKKIEKEKIKVEQQTFKPYLIIDQNFHLFYLNFCSSEKLICNLVIIIEQVSPSHARRLLQHRGYRRLPSTERGTQIELNFGLT